MGWILRSIQVQKIIKSNPITKKHNQSNIRNQLNIVPTPETNKIKVDHSEIKNKMKIILSDLRSHL